MTPEKATGVPHVLKLLGQRYVQHVNRSYRRTSGLFEGRFRFSLVDAASHQHSRKVEAGNSNLCGY